MNRLFETVSEHDEGLHIFNSQYERLYAVVETRLAATMNATIDVLSIDGLAEGWAKLRELHTEGFRGDPFTPPERICAVMVQKSGRCGFIYRFGTFEGEAEEFRLGPPYLQHELSKV